MSIDAISGMRAQRKSHARYAPTLFQSQRARAAPLPHMAAEHDRKTAFPLNCAALLRYVKQAAAAWYTIIEVQAYRSAAFMPRRCIGHRRCNKAAWKDVG